MRVFVVKIGEKKKEIEAYRVSTSKIPNFKSGNLIKEEEIPMPPRIEYSEFMRLAKEAEEKRKRGDWRVLRRVVGNLNSVLEAVAKRR